MKNSGVRVAFVNEFHPRNPYNLRQSAIQTIGSVDI